MGDGIIRTEKHPAQGPSCCARLQHALGRWINSALFSIALIGLTAAARAGDIAIVIDDVGYNKAAGARAIHLPGPVTIAVLPFAPHTRELVSLAALYGKDIIVHQPMEPRPSAHVREEHGTLKLAMPQRDFDAAVAHALDTIPERVGVSNHTGSLLTAHRQPMVRLMSQLSARGLYFLDSRTTAATVALQVAREMGVPATRRDVFLDHDRRPAAVAAAFAEAIKVARTKGHAVLVGHPYAVSLDLLEEKLAELPRDIRLVPVAELAVTQPAVYPTELVLRQPPTDPRISLGQ